MGMFRRRRGAVDSSLSADRARELEIINFDDTTGRTVSMTRAELRDRYIPDQLQSHWHDAEGLARIAQIATGAGLPASALEITARLIIIDRNPVRGVALHADALRHAGRLDDAREVCLKFESSFGDAGSVLYVLAHIEEDLGNDDAMREIIWRAVQADPNTAVVLDWWIRVEIQQTSTTIDECLRRASQIEQAWLPLLRAARARDAASGADAAAVYGEILKRGGHESKVLLSVIGDLGIAGQFDTIVDTVVPWYSPSRHESLVGLSLLQACIDAKRFRDADSVLIRLGTDSDPETRAEVKALATQLDALRSVDIARSTRPVSIATNPSTRQDLGPAPSVSQAPLAHDLADEIRHAADESLAPIRTKQVPTKTSAPYQKPAQLADVASGSYRDDAGWYRSLGYPDFLFGQKPTSVPIMAIPLFAERTNDPVLSGLAVGLPRLINDVLHCTTSARSHSFLPTDNNGAIRLPNGTYLADDMRALLVRHIPLKTLAISGEVSGASDTKRIRIVLADGESLQPIWSYGVNATPATLSRAVDELLVAVEEELAERKLLVPTTPPAWFVVPPVYLAAAYVQAEATLIQLDAAAQHLLPPSIGERAVEMLEPIKELALSHSVSSMPRIFYAAGCVAAFRTTGTLAPQLLEQLQKFVNAEPLPGQPLQMIRPLLTRIGITPGDQQANNQLAAADLRFADWLEREAAEAR